MRMAFGVIVLTGHRGYAAKPFASGRTKCMDNGAEYSAGCLKPLLMSPQLHALRHGSPTVTLPARVIDRSGFSDVAALNGQLLFHSRTYPQYLSNQAG